MKDYRSMEKDLVVIPVMDSVVFPDSASVIRVTRQWREGFLKSSRDKAYALALRIRRPEARRDPAIDDLENIGTLVRVEAIVPQGQEWEVRTQGLARIKVDKLDTSGEGIRASFEFLDDILDMDEATAQAMLRNIRDLSLNILDLLENTDKAREAVLAYDSLGPLLNFCSHHLNIPAQQKQELLEILSLKSRGLHILDDLAHQREGLKLQLEMNRKVSESAGRSHRENILREQLRQIKDELGEGPGKTKGKDYRQKLEEADLPEAIREAALEEVERLEMQAPNTPEIAIIRNYLDLILALPWKDPMPADIDLDKARAILDEDHHGLQEVKDRIIQQLAVMKLKKDRKGALLLFVGPPGVGKTSLGRSIARAMGKNFIRASLGGVRDDSEIRGHRRTYVGAMPGRIIQSMKRAGERNPVFLLDEIDKLVRGYNGDPAASLLEVLDPEQNTNFSDHYLDLPYDLSSVFFIATANSTETIPRPLLDRMEVIEITGYTPGEKRAIARNHLIPKQLEEHGLGSETLVIPEDIQEKLISAYTREAGVRELQRKITALCRIASPRILALPPEKLPLTVSQEDLNEWLGPERYRSEELDHAAPPGVVTGLAWTPMGGEILHIEGTTIPGTGQFTLTGQLGDVMKESARIALSLIRSQLGALVQEVPFKELDVHIHVPSGAVPKDGPSAGITMLTMLVSLFLNQRVDQKLALTGEVTLRGAVMPVGGIKEKLIAAHRAGIRRIIMPRKNEKDLRELPEEVRGDLEIHLVERSTEVFELVFGITSPEPLEQPWTLRSNSPVIPPLA